MRCLIKNFLRLLLLLILLAVFQPAWAQKFTVVQKGNAKARIVLPEKSTVVEVQAAKVLQDYLERISGSVLPIATDDSPQQEGEILIGNVNRPALAGLPKEKLGTDGIYLKNDGKTLIIAGGTEKGTLYAVYSLLEKYLGCRKYSSHRDLYTPK
jgi:alpha-glucuronidase